MKKHDTRVWRWFLLGVTAWVTGACSGDNVTTPTRGSIRVETTTQGADLDATGYTVAIDQTQPTQIGLSDQLVVDNLTLGRHQVTLAELAANCTPSVNPQSIDVVGADTVVVSFTVTCEAITPPPGGGN